MLLVKTRTGPSPIAGTGLFAAETIPAGAPIWRFKEGFDEAFTREQLGALDERAWEKLRTYAYLSRKSGRYILCADDARFINHSRTPNTTNRSESGEPEVVTRAARDIPPGEEITADYNEFEKRVSYFSPKLEVRDCSIGRGIFAKAPIRKGEVVQDWSTGPGHFLPTKEAASHEKKGNHFIVQVEEESYLVAVDGPEPADFINHSCDPTCGIRGRLTVVALRDIARDEQITFDYAMTESWPWYKMVCRCGSPRCRHLVTGRDWKMPDLRKRYKGYFSDYITRKMDRGRLRRVLERMGF